MLQFDRCLDRFRSRWPLLYFGVGHAYPVDEHLGRQCRGIRFVSLPPASDRQIGHEEEGLLEWPRSRNVLGCDTEVLIPVEAPADGSRYPVDGVGVEVV